MGSGCNRETEKEGKVGGQVAPLVPEPLVWMLSLA